jgi:protein tyrosine phosphatase (PTP) superfamily phosphohydrolase (DUF442 family)
MALVPLRTLLDHAAEHEYGLAAFNVNNMEQIQAIMEAAEETDSPVIVQASRGARKYSQDAYLKHLMLAAVELYPHIPITMHQDHGNSVDTCQSAIDNGFTSVMMDGSLKEDGKTPADYGLPWFTRIGNGRSRRWPRSRRRSVARSTADGSRGSRSICGGYGSRRVGGCYWNQPRGL